MWCLPKYLANEFLGKLKDGSIDPQKLSQMSSAERRAFFNFLGEENAKQANTLFESKLLLKNQQQGMITWAKQIGGLTPKAQRDIIARVNKMDEVLNPASEKAFLEDLAEHKLGTAVTMEEAAKISQLAKESTDKLKIMESSKRREFGEAPTAAEMDYGYARTDFAQYVNDLKTDASKMTIAEMKANKLEAIKRGLGHIPGMAKSAKATLDNSALLRQGWRTLLTHPSVWYKNSVQSFIDIAQTLGGKNVMREVNADIVSRPYYENYIKDELAVSVVEEAFPDSKMLEKIPGVGRLHKASEAAFTAFAHRNRADLYDLYTEIAKNSGMEETTGQGLGRLVNSLTGRGNLGSWERNATMINNVFFSPRLIKSHLDVLGLGAQGLAEGALRLIGKENLIPKSEVYSEFVKKQAAINLVKIIGGTASVLVLANAVMPGSVETDPRSSDFGRIKAGDTRFDVTGGMSSVLVLAARLATMSSKSTNTGEVTSLWSGGYKAKTGLDVVEGFLENKLSPTGGLIRDLLKGYDYDYKPITVGGEIKNMFAPLPITNTIELYQSPNGAPVLLGAIADALGISTNTYAPKAKKTVITQ